MDKAPTFRSRATIAADKKRAQAKTQTSNEIYGGGTPWRKVREQKLQSTNYMCEPCLAKGIITKATTVHHLRSVHTHPHLRYDMSNLQSICIKCHTEAHSHDPNHPVHIYHK